MSGSNRVAAGIAISRAFGLLREVMIGAVLGSTGTADAFRQAMRIPNIIQNLLGEGSLGASFVPVFARLVEEENEEEARHVAGGVLGLLTAVIVVVVAAVVLLADPLVSLLAPGNSPAVHDLAASLTRITAIGIGILGLSAWSLAILNSHREFFLGYAAPALWSIAQILTLGLVVVLGLSPSAEERLIEADRTGVGVGELILDGDARVARWLAIAMVVGSALQLLVMVPRVRRLTASVTPHLQVERQVTEVLRRFAPAVGARGVVQVSGFIDMFLASFLTTGSLALLALALPLYLLPIAVFGFSVATSELTEISRASDRSDAVVKRVRIGLRKVTLSAGFSTAMLLFAGTSIASALFLWPNELLGQGTLTADQTLALGIALAVFALALPTSMSARITQNALYALGNTRTPARVALIRLGVTSAVSVLVMFQFDRLQVIEGAVTNWSALPHFPPWEPVAESTRHLDGQATLGVAGLAAGSVAGSLVEWVLLRRALIVATRQPLRSGLAFPVFAAVLGTGAVAGVIQRFFGLPDPLEAAVVGLGGLAAYVGALRFQGLRPQSVRLRG